jgi:hypothetical protein
VKRVAIIAAALLLSAACVPPPVREASVSIPFEHVTQIRGHDGSGWYGDVLYFETPRDRCYIFTGTQKGGISCIEKKP